MFNKEKTKLISANYTKNRQGNKPDLNIYTPKYLATLNLVKMPLHNLIILKHFIVILIIN